MKIFEQELKLINEKLGSVSLGEKPEELYEPIRYTLSLGGKRIRPLMTLLSCEMFGGEQQKAIPVALAIEIFHNFTLIHDDIMDEAPLRRGKETVYKKWSANVGILSGDAMLAKAFEMLTECDEKHLRKLVSLLSKVAIEVCEGQQWDLNFERSEKVSIADYLNMIRLKTAVLIGSCVKAGAIVADASRENMEKIYNYGENLGMAFQLKDDLLDVFGDEKKFGKQKGGDIAANKKTFLFLKAKEMAGEKDLEDLNHFFTDTSIDKNHKIEAVSSIYKKLGIHNYTEQLINQYFEKSLLYLKEIDMPEQKKEKLHALTDFLMQRDF